MKWEEKNFKKTETRWWKGWGSSAERA